MLSKTDDPNKAKIVFYVSFVAVLAIIMVSWWQGSGVQLTSSTDRLVAIARLFGLLASFCILLQILLMSRIPLFERNFSLEETINLHRLNGYALLFMIVGHVVFMTFGYRTGASTSLWQQFVLLNTGFEDVYKATIGTVIFFCATFLTLRLVRKHLTYELWYLTHLTVYFAILLTFMHQVNSGGDFIKHTWFKYFWYALFAVVFGLLAYFRFAKMFIHAWQYDFKVQSIVCEAEGIYSIYIDGRNARHFQFIPGQYASWRFMTGYLWLEAHPFSFSQSPGHKLLRITAKISGDFSNKISQIKPGTRVLLDGPRGAFTSHLAKNKSVTLIAGGIGVAPFMSKIPGLLELGKKVTLLYSVRDPQTLAFRSELKELQTQGLNLQTFVTSRGSRITTDILTSTISKQTTVFICGPDAMTKSLPIELKQHGLPKDNIITERFGF